MSHIANVKKKNRSLSSGCIKSIIYRKVPKLFMLVERYLESPPEVGVELELQQEELLPER